MARARRDSRKTESRNTSAPGSQARSQPRPHLGGGIDRRNRKIFFRRLGVLKPLADAVDQLLDREQANQHAGQGYRGIERRDRRARGKAETAKTSEIVEVAKPDQAKRNAENHDADDDFDDHARRAMHRLGDRGQIQMIVAAGGYRPAAENLIDEKRGRDLLQPQPGTTPPAGGRLSPHPEGET